MPSAFRRTDEALVLTVRLTPNAGRDEIGSVVIRDNGEAALGVRVKAQPHKGAANAALIALLAKRLSVPKSALSVAGGARERNKQIVISDRLEDAERGLAALIGERKTA